jgi:Tol biopolymer transport system component
MLKANDRFAYVIGAALMLITGCTDSPPPLDPTEPPPPMPPVSPPVTPPIPPGSQPPPPIGASGLYISSVDGSDPVFLVNGARPAWSPDSRHIAFHADGYVHVINADGSGLVRITPGITPAWSPDGKQLVYSSDKGIATINVDGSGDLFVVVQHHFRTDTWPEGDMGVSQPAWSPDGKRITFVHHGDGDMMPGQVFVVNVDGSNLFRLTSDGRGNQYSESDPAWSPDGSSIVLWSYGFGIAVAPASGGPAVSVYLAFPGVAYGSRPTWTADGRALLFSYGLGSPHPSVWRVAVMGGVARQLIADAYDATASPDGTRIAFGRR